MASQIQKIPVSGQPYATLLEDEGNDYLIPDKILSIKDQHFEAAGIFGDSIEPTKEKLAQAVREGICWIASIPGGRTPGQIERYLIYLGTKPGTPEGEFFRFLMRLRDIPPDVHHEALKIRDR